MSSGFAATMHNARTWHNSSDENIWTKITPKLDYNKLWSANINQSTMHLKAQTEDFNLSMQYFNESKSNVEFTKSWEALAITMIIAIVAMGNILAILAVTLDRKLQSSTNYFLMSLAVADLLVAMTVMPPSLAMIINNYSWPFPDVMCGIWAMLDVCFSTSSILHLCMISLDRYMALADPFGNSSLSTDHDTKGNDISQGNRRGLCTNIFLDAEKCMKTCVVLRLFSCSSKNGGHVSRLLAGSGKKRVFKRIILVWATSIGIALPLPILQSQNREYLFVGDMCAINIANFQIYGSLVAFFLPLVIMIITYSLTIRSLQKQAKFISNMLGNKDSKRSSQKQPASYDAKPTVVHDGQQNKTTSICCFEKQNYSQENSFKIPIKSADEESIDYGFSSRTSVVHHVKYGNDNGTSLSCWKTCSFISVREGADWASNETEDHNFHSEYRRKINAEKRPVHKTESDGSRESDTRSPLISRANIHIGKALSKVTRGKTTVSRKISSSFKAKAIANISTEQRASKVLGLIFVLFCVFWCPFFITNVVSRLCTSCDEELIGQLMNWFVWVGYVSSGVNPLVYTLFSRRFRATFSCLLTCNYSKINRPKTFRVRSVEDNRSSSLRQSNSNYLTDRRDATNEITLKSSPLIANNPQVVKTHAALQRNAVHSRSVVVHNTTPRGADQVDKLARPKYFTRQAFKSSLPSRQDSVSLPNVKKTWRTTWPTPIQEHEENNVMKSLQEFQSQQTNTNNVSNSSSWERNYGSTDVGTTDLTRTRKCIKQALCMSSTGNLSCPKTEDKLNFHKQIMPCDDALIIECSTLEKETNNNNNLLYSPKETKRTLSNVSYNEVMLKSKNDMNINESVVDVVC